ncbi:hypothetical protein PR048_029905 [Dryococelus australis]|uniref:DRBM domain-containing protein n=1 Tax=Dryococelus australis TaxID=614101 RepID=A0ABQ9G7G1_9NEOP|nr:hypothetical protein PR048_029905 [Dryococelus australis]
MISWTPFQHRVFVHLSSFVRATWPVHCHFKVAVFSKMSLTSVADLMSVAFLFSSPLPPAEDVKRCDSATTQHCVKFGRIGQRKFRAACCDRWREGLKYCGLFCDVCFFPRLQDFIMNQDWNDPKSKLQQCCLTLRSMDGGEPDIPIYKQWILLSLAVSRVIECKGPTNTREYTVAVYFRQKRLAKACGHSIQMAEMNAARKALENSKGKVDILKTANSNPNCDPVKQTTSASQISGEGKGSEDAG